MVPIVGVQTTDHVKVMNDAITVKLSAEEIRSIQDAAPFNPLFPMNFLFDTKGDKGYSTKLTLADHVQYKMGAWIDAPAKHLVWNKSLKTDRPCNVKEVQCRKGHGSRSRRLRERGQEIRMFTYLSS